MKGLYHDGVNGFTFEYLAEKEAYQLHNEIFDRGCYYSSIIIDEKEEEEEEEMAVVEDPIILDIGANIGLFSIYKTLYMENTPIIYAFEPINEIYNVCKRNLSRVSYIYKHTYT